VWLFDSVLTRVQNPKKPQQKFLCHLMRLMLMLPGRMTFRNLSRYSPYHEKTFARWFARDVDFVSLNHAAIVDVVPHNHEHVLAFDPSFVPKSGKHTYGLDMFWNGAHSRAEQGLEIATLAWIEVTPNRAYTLSVEQTSPAPQSGTEETRIETDVAHIARVVTTQPLQALKYLAVDGYFSKKKFVDGVCALDLHVIGKLRRDANLRRLYSGPRGASPGRPKIYDGKVDVSHLAHFEQLDAGDADITLHSQVVNHPQLKRNLHLVVVRHLPTGRYALLFSTDVALSAKTIYRYYKARFQIEFLFRDAKQFTGLSDCQARSADKLRFHFNASLSAVSFAKLEARQSSDKPQAPFSMASLKRRYFNQHLVDRILDHLATEGRLEKCSAVYAELCNYGTIDDVAA
jgi:DDE superfamily endonuclease